MNENSTMAFERILLELERHYNFSDALKTEINQEKFSQEVKMAVVLIAIQLKKLNYAECETDLELLNLMLTIVSNPKRTFKDFLTIFLEDIGVDINVPRERESRLAIVARSYKNLTKGDLDRYWTQTIAECSIRPLPPVTPERKRAREKHNIIEDFHFNPILNQKLAVAKATKISPISLDNLAALVESIKDFLESDANPGKECASSMRELCNTLSKMGITENNIHLKKTALKDSFTYILEKIYEILNKIELPTVRDSLTAILVKSINEVPPENLSADLFWFAYMIIDDFYAGNFLILENMGKILQDIQEKLPSYELFEGQADGELMGFADEEIPGSIETGGHYPPSPPPHIQLTR